MIDRALDDLVKSQPTLGPKGTAFTLMIYGFQSQGNTYAYLHSPSTLNNAKVKLYFERCLKLRFDEDPNYSSLKKLFKYPGYIDWNDKKSEIMKIKPKDKISDSGVDTPGTSL